MPSARRINRRGKIPAKPISRTGRTQFIRGTGDGGTKFTQNPRVLHKLAHHQLDKARSLSDGSARVGSNTLSLVRDKIDSDRQKEGLRRQTTSCR